MMKNKTSNENYRNNGYIRFLSLFLAMVSIITLVPVEVWAQSNEEQKKNNTVIETIDVDTDMGTSDKNEDLTSYKYDILLGNESIVETGDNIKKEELNIDANNYSAGNNVFDLSSKEGINNAFNQWFSDMSSVVMARVDREYLDRKYGISEDIIDTYVCDSEGYYYGVETIDEFYPSVIKVWKDSNHLQYTYAWLYEKNNGVGVEYKAGNVSSNPVFVLLEVYIMISSYIELTLLALC